MTKNKPTLENCQLDIDGFLESNDSIFSQGKKVIELIGKSYDYMSLGTDLLAKAKMAKIVLSNLVLRDGSIGFSYENPFDNLTKNLTAEKWWALTGSNRRHLPCKGSALPAELNAHFLVRN